uniref:Uncharacterized protein n=1 Tax=Thermofilum adornatum TaxID=1365176 RepID=A0A7C1GDQ8_9CREN
MSFARWGSSVVMVKPTSTWEMWFFNMSMSLVTNGDFVCTLTLKPLCRRICRPLLVSPSVASIGW